MQKVLGQLLNVDGWEIEQKNPSVMETEGTEAAHKTLRTTRIVHPGFILQIQSKIDAGSHCHTRLHLQLNGPFKPSIWTFDIMSRLEFVLTFTAAGPRGITFLQ